MSCSPFYLLYQAQQCSVNDGWRNGGQIPSILNVVLDRSTQHEEGCRLRGSFSFSVASRWTQRIFLFWKNFINHPCGEMGRRNTQHGCWHTFETFCSHDLCTWVWIPSCREFSPTWLLSPPRPAKLVAVWFAFLKSSRLTSIHLSPALYVASHSTMVFICKSPIYAENMGSWCIHQGKCASVVAHRAGHSFQPLRHSETKREKDTCRNYYNTKRQVLGRGLEPACWLARGCWRFFPGCGAFVTGGGTSQKSANEKMWRMVFNVWTLCVWDLRRTLRVSVHLASEPGITLLFPEKWLIFALTGTGTGALFHLSCCWVWAPHCSSR